MMLELGAFVLAPVAGAVLRRCRCARRRRYVDGWVHARWRLRRDLIKAVKGLCLLAYYSDRARRARGSATPSRATSPTSARSGCAVMLQTFDE